MYKMILSVAIVLIVGSEAAFADEVAVAQTNETRAASTVLSKSVPRGWCEDFEAATKQAKNDGKKMLVVFSGSDWCHWCVKLDEETYSRKEFVDLASKKYVLVMIDLPMDQSKLSDLAKKQNRALAKKFNVQGFPHGVVLNSDGAELGRIGGYVQGGPKAYFEAMEACRPGPLAK